MPENAPGYSTTTKWLHWGIFFLMVAQFVVGYTMAESDDDSFSEDRLFLVHVAFGLLILFLAVIRVWWRRVRPLPPWAPTLSSLERRYAHHVERALYTLQFLIPLTGLGLAVSDGKRLPILGRLGIADLLEEADDLFEIAHIGSHLVFFGVLALHVGLVLKHQWIDRDHLLDRML